MSQSFELGDHVVFAKDPLMYGVLRIGVKTADDRLVCEPCHPVVPHHRRRPEIFFLHELAAFTDPLVDLDEIAELEAKKPFQEPEQPEEPKKKRGRPGWIDPEKLGDNTGSGWRGYEVEDDELEDHDGLGSE